MGLTVVLTLMQERSMARARKIMVLHVAFK
jgi:hypothetical protein